MRNDSTNLWTSCTPCFNDHHYKSFCLLRDSMSRATRSLDLCILFKFIFLYLWYIPPHSCTFHTFYLHQFFHMYITYITLRFFICTFFLSLMMPLIGKSSQFNFNFYFSSQRPHLNIILLSIVYSFEFQSNISANLL